MSLGPLRNKAYKGSQAFSWMESSQLPIGDWICSFVHTLGDFVYYVQLCHCFH